MIIAKIDVYIYGIRFEEKKLQILEVIKATVGVRVRVNVWIRIYYVYGRESIGGGTLSKCNSNT